MGEVHDFNQAPNTSVSALRGKVDMARSEGKLNISAMGLKSLPEEVMKMYDFEYNKSNSRIAWAESVDLIKFIAADNELESIPDEAFPDVEVDAFCQEDETANTQFLGIEVLDLHGNMLVDVPCGFRRLARLTVLNMVSRENARVRILAYSMAVAQWVDE